LFPAEMALQPEALELANQRLEHENWMMRAMQTNQRLAAENIFLRMQCSGGFFPSTYVRSQDLALAMLPEVQTLGRASAAGNACNANPYFDASTIAGSSSLGSVPSSRNQSRVPSVDSSGQTSVVANRTSVMMKNLPNDYTREMLVDLLKEKGYEGSFDLLYLPKDFRTKAGFGYAFVNFVAPDIAARFQHELSGFNGWSRASAKVCEVTWSDVQGLEEHIRRYRNSPVMHQSVPDEYRPMLFVGSEQVSFPSPTQKIRPPSHWRRRR
jgi:hypothetical protein